MTKKIEEKRTYKKPKLEEVNLVPEEAVLVTCKLQGGGIQGPNNIQCKGTTPTGQGDCVTQVS